MTSWVRPRLVHPEPLLRASATEKASLATLFTSGTRSLNILIVCAQRTQTNFNVHWSKYSQEGEATKIYSVGMVRSAFMASWLPGILDVPHGRFSPFVQITKMGIMSGGEKIISFYFHFFHATARPTARYWEGGEINFFGVHSTNTHFLVHLAMRSQSIQEPPVISCLICFPMRL